MRRRDLHVARVGHISVHIGKGQFHGFNLQVLRIDAIDFHAAQIKVFQNTQGNQGCNALSIGGNFVQGVATVILRNRLYPFRTVLRQVLQSHGTAMLIRKLHQGFCNFTFIKSFAFGLGNGAQATCRRFELKQLSHVGGTAPWQKALCKTRQGLQKRRSGKPFLLNDHGQGIASFGNFNGRLHQVGKGQFAKAIAEGHPSTDSARHRD